MVEPCYVKRVPRKLFAAVLQKRSSWKIYKIHRETPVLDSLFNKVAGKTDSNTSAIPWILQDFQEQIFYSTPPATPSGRFSQFKCH